MDSVVDYRRGLPVINPIKVKLHVQLLHKKRLLEKLAEVERKIEELQNSLNTTPPRIN